MVLEIIYTHYREILIALLVIFLFHIFRKIFTKYIFNLILRFSNKTKNHFVSNVLEAFEKPLRVFITFIGFFVAYQILPFPDTIDAIVLNMVRSFIAILIAWGLYNLSSTNSVLMTRIGDRFNVEDDDIIVPFLSKILRFAIIVMGISIVADLWGYSVSGFVAGLGLGGLAFALAAQDSLSNFFGGVVIITEKAFKVGDWIATPSVEGTVEDISFRSTQIRTFAQALVTVPNSTLANEPITNWSEMGKRRINFTLEVMKDTPREKIVRCVERIDTLLRNSEEIHQETIMVRFNEFKENGLGIYLYFFTVTTVWSEYLRVRESMNLQIMDILNEEGVFIALPSRNIYVENESIPQDKLTEKIAKNDE